MITLDDVIVGELYETVCMNIIGKTTEKKKYIVLILSISKRNSDYFQPMTCLLGKEILFCNELSLERKIS